MASQSVWSALLAGGLIGVAVTTAFNSLTTWTSRRREDRYRQTTSKRELYGRFLAVLTEVRLARSTCDSAIADEQRNRTEATAAARRDAIEAFLACRKDQLDVMSQIDSPSEERACRRRLCILANTTEGWRRRRKRP